MTTHDDRNALAILAFLARLGSQLDAFRNQLQQQLQLQAASFVESRYYGNDVYLCVCLEAAPQEDRTLTWWMDITPREGMWLIGACVSWNGRTPVVQTGPQRVYDFQAVQAEVPGILEQLLQAGAAVLDKIMAQKTSEEHGLSMNDSEVVE